MITIYDFPRGARGLRAAWVCEEMGLEYRFMSVSFPPDEHYLLLNPFGTVPLLQDDDLLICESVAMIIYIAQKYGPTDIFPDAEDSCYAKILQFAILGEASLSSPMTPLLTARYGAAQETQKRNWSVLGIESRLKRTIVTVDDQLGDREFLVGASFSLADISVVTALRIWKRGLNEKISPRLDAYCERLQERPACKRAMAKHI
ncbi:MAG: glutathione S-transferase family protein [Aestuariivirga sp.]